MSRRRAILAGFVSAALAVPLSLSAAQAAPGDEPPSGPGSSVPMVRPDGLQRAAGETNHPAISPALIEADGVVTAFVELDAPSGIETAEAGGDPADVAAAAEDVVDIAEEVVPADAGTVAEETPAKIDVTTNVVSGMIVTGDAEQIRALADDPAVTAVHLVVPKTIDNKGTDVFTGALQAWKSAGATGEGVTIGVIDTGLDYTHAMFGGTGTVEAYEEAYGTDGTGPIPDGALNDKFLGGYDFAGPTYDANVGNAPAGDANPIDAPHTSENSGHGTHVAGTATGYGVQADGSTFKGDYATLTDISGWRIGPGSAPEAGLYALKVFGDAGGSTSLVISALDWAADPNGDSNFDDHLDIVNMSLGSDFSAADDPENLFVDGLATIGVLTVTSAGNGSDVTDVGGSPGSARSALTVANSVGNSAIFDAVEVTEAGDASVIGLHPAQNTAYYTGTDDVTAPVAYIGGDVSGCTSLEDYRSQIKNTIVWLWWDDNDSSRACGSLDRWINAQAAGAVGVLIGTELPVFPAGIGGIPTLPGAQLTAASTDILLPLIEAATAETPVVVHLGPSLASAGFVVDPALGDTLSTGSSRGVHGSLGVVKPDVAAPGTLISSAASGTGNDPSTLSGTSMSSPHVAGIAALVAQRHPDFTPQQIKAAVMNTATHDLYTDLGQTGSIYGPERVGSGRVDAFDAANAEVLAFATDASDLVSVTFGVVPVGADTVVLEKTVTVQNTGRHPRTYATSFAGATTAGGATITVSPRRVTVRPGRTARVTVRLTADPATLQREIDPTQASSYPSPGVAREYVTSISGRLVLTPAHGPELRVPVQAAPRPFSELTTPAVTFAADQTEAPLTVEGRGVASGGWYSLMAPFVLTATSTELEPGSPDTTSASAIRAADLKAVGFTSTAPEIEAAGYDPALGTLGLGIATYGEWASLGGAVVPIIDTDIDGDGIWDLETYVWKYAADMDFTTVETYALGYDPSTGYSFGPMLDIWEANGLSGARDTSVFDSNALVVPMTMAAVGIAPGDTPTFVVAMYSPYAESPTGIVDETEQFTVDPFDPPVWFDSDPAAGDNTLWYYGQTGTDVTVHRSADAADARLLVLHTHNAAGDRAQIVDLVVQAPKAVSHIRALVPRSVRQGTPVPVSVVIRSEGASPTGTVEVYEGTSLLGTAAVLVLRRTGFAVVVVRGLAVGSHNLTITYTGNDQVAPSSTEARVRVTPRGPGHGWW